MPDGAKEYLGDGVYVENYYGDLMLSTDRSGVTHWIVLGPAEYAALLAYVAARTRSTSEGAEA